MGAPSVYDHVKFSSWIYSVEKPVDEIDDNKAVFPGIKPIMSLTSVKVFRIK